jgi:hypothetical protein
VTVVGTRPACGQSRVLYLFPEIAPVISRNRPWPKPLEVHRAVFKDVREPDDY